ncbi:Hypothetical protein HVR_LOCUS390 [uncultured virus]|nr:Hypothetical protein HVR_LOCUS390 [uncultured virus]
MTNNNTTIEDELTIAEWCQLETDLENGQYESWTARFPNRVEEIFGLYLRYRSNHVSVADLQRFQALGVDLDKQSRYYDSDAGVNTPLGFACEYRHPSLIKNLVRMGVNVNQPINFDPMDSKENDAMSPLETLLQGHSMNDCSVDESECVESCLKGLNADKLENKIHKWIFDEHCQEYLESDCNYLKEFLRSMTIIE